jgi:hypothetical protein
MALTTMASSIARRMRLQVVAVLIAAWSVPAARQQFERAGHDADADTRVIPSGGDHQRILEWYGLNRRQAC